MAELVVWLRKIKENSLSLVGKKAVDLEKLYSKDFPVPPGFIVTSEAYKIFYSKVEPKIKTLLKGLDLSSEATVQNVANEIQKWIIYADFPKELEYDVEEAYNSMDTNISFGKKLTADYFLKTKEKAKVCIRSSPVSEIPEALSAGVFPVFSEVQGVAQLKRAIKACWASLFTAKALSFREKNKFDHRKVHNAVIVQKMVYSDKSGLAYTRNPGSGKKEIVIEAIKGVSKGLEEFLPSTYRVDSLASNILGKDEKVQRQAYFVAEKGRLAKNDLPDLQISKPVLENREIIRVANIAKEIEETFSTPMKIEFAVESGSVYLMDANEMIVPTSKEEEMKYYEDEEDAEEQPEEQGVINEEETETTEQKESPEESEVEEAAEETAEEETEATEEVEEVAEAETETTEQETVTEETTEEESAEESEASEEETTEEVEEAAEQETTAEETTEEESAEESEASEEETTEETEQEPDFFETEETSKESEAAEEPQEAEETETTEETPEEEMAEKAEETTEEAEEIEKDYESRLQELFEEYSARINSILEEFKEEALNIVKR